MPNIEIKETEYYNCPYCHRTIPDYAICNCVKIYNQALDDAIDFFTEHIYDKTNKYIVRNYVCDRLEKMKK